MESRPNLCHKIAKEETQFQSQHVMMSSLLLKCSTARGSSAGLVHRKSPCIENKEHFVDFYY